MKKNFIEKICNVLHKNVVSNWGTVPLSLYPYEEDYDDYYLDIYNYIGEYITTEEYDIQEQLFMLFIYNYNEYGDYTQVEIPKNFSDDDISDEKQAIAKFFRTIPYLVKKQKYLHYKLSVYSIPDEFYEYAIGNKEQMEDSLVIYAEEFWNSNTWNVLSTLGYDDFIDFCYVTNTDKRIISGEVADNAVDMMHGDLIIEYLRDYDEYDIVNEYDYLEDMLNQTNDDEEREEISNKMSEIENSSIELVRGLIYDDTYNKLETTDGLTEFLYENSYISLDGGYIVTERQWSVFPRWVKFDWDSFLKWDAKNREYTDISDDETYDVFRYNNDIYYIIRIV